MLVTASVSWLCFDAKYFLSCNWESPCNRIGADKHHSFSLNCIYNNTFYLWSSACALPALSIYLMMVPLMLSHRLRVIYLLACLLMYISGVQFQPWRSSSVLSSGGKRGVHAVFTSWLHHFGSIASFCCIHLYEKPHPFCLLSRKTTTPTNRTQSALWLGGELRMHPAWTTTRCVWKSTLTWNINCGRGGFECNCFRILSFAHHLLVSFCWKHFQIIRTWIFFNRN